MISSEGALYRIVHWLDIKKVKYSGLPMNKQLYLIRKMKTYSINNDQDQLHAFEISFLWRGGQHGVTKIGKEIRGTKLLKNISLQIVI